MVFGGDTVSAHKTKVTSFSASFTRAASTSAILIGISAILGWWFDLPVLRSVYAPFAPTTPNSALSMLLIGLSLWLAMGRQKRAEPFTARQAVAILFVVVVITLALTTILEYVTNRDLGVDQWIFHQAVVDSSSPVRMAPTSAVNFLTVGLALLLTLLEWGIPAAQLLGLSASFIGVLAMTGYLFRIPSLYAVGPYTPMSIQMAVMSAVLGFAVLTARPNRALMIVLASPNVGGVVARRLLPIGMGFPFLLGLLAYLAQVARLGRTPFGGVIFLFFGIVMFTVPILWTAALLYRTDRKRERAERHVATQYGIARLLANPVPAHEIARPILEVICTKLGWTGGIIWEVEPDGQTRRVAAFNEDAATQDQRTSFPIRIDGTVIGTIECWGEESLIHDEEVVRVMETIATQIGQFVERRRGEGEIRRLNRDLQDRAQQLEAANKELEAFSYSVSHDLRAPLRHISGFVQLLGKKSGSSLDAEGVRYLGIISDACAKMGELVDDLLAFSRMGRADMQKARIDLNDVVRQIVNELRHSTEGRNIQWSIDALPEVEGDAAMIRIVLMNYISNAIKYTQRRETAMIEIGSSNGDSSEITIYVRDNGAGFDMKYAGKLFGVFQRLHRDDEFEGTGIGLATARRIIARHGGTTWVDAALDKGATFYFSLPVKTENAVAAEVGV